MVHVARKIKSGVCHFSCIAICVPHDLILLYLEACDTTVVIAVSLALRIYLPRQTVNQKVVGHNNLHNLASRLLRMHDCFAKTIVVSFYSRKLILFCLRISLKTNLAKLLFRVVKAQTHVLRGKIF